MPEVIDWGEKFRQLGSDVSNAITAPVQMRLKMAVMNSEKEKEDKKTAAQAKLAESLSPQERILYEAEGYGPVQKQHELTLKKARAGGSGGGGGGGGGGGTNKYMKQFLLAQQMTGQLGEMQSAAQEKVDQARQSGDLDAVAQAMEGFNAVHEGAQKVKMFIASFSSEGRNAVATKLMEDLDGTLGQYDSSKLDAIQETVKGKVTKSGGLNSSIATTLENTKDAYGMGIDLSGVPSNAALEKYLVTATVKGDMPMATAQFIKSGTDYNALLEIANDTDNVPQSVRLAAGAKALRLTTFEALVPDGDKKLKAASDAALADVAFGSGKSIEDRIVSAAAKKELTQRGRFDEPEKVGQGRKVNAKSKEARVEETLNVVKDTKAKLEKLEANPTGRGVPQAIKALRARLDTAKNTLKSEGFAVGE